MNQTNKTSPIKKRIARISKKGDMTTSIVTYNKGKMSADEVAKLFYTDSRINVIVRSVCMKFRIKENHDELKQRAILVIFEKYINSINNPSGFYSLWYATVKRCALELNSETKTESFYDEESENLLTDAASYAVAMGNKSLEDITAEKLTADKFNAIFDAAPDHFKNIVSNFNAKQKRAVKIVANNGGPDHDLLIKIREKLNISIGDFATKLGITEFRLSSYIYKKTKEVPASIMAKAKLIIKQERVQSKERGRLEKLKISTLVRRWCKLLDIDDVTLSKILHVSNSTMERWKEDITKPEIRRLSLYNDVITKMAKLKVQELDRQDQD